MTLPVATAEPRVKVLHAAAHSTRRAVEPTYSLRGSLRTVLPVWGVFTALRWAVALSVGHVFTPSSAFAASGVRALVCTWDASIFLTIADDGYLLDQTPFLAAFFPGFPLAARTLAGPLSLVVGDQEALLTSAVLLTSTCSLGAALLIHRIAYEKLGRLTAGWTVVLLMAWPSAAFFTALYSEGLYMVAAMGAWLLATRGRWILSGLLCGVASFTRVTGVFLCAALLVMYVTTVLRGRERFRRGNLAGAMLGGWGVAAFFVFLFLRTGDPMEWFHIQDEVWGRHTVTPWSAFQSSWTQMFSTAPTDYRWQTAADMAIVLIWATLAAIMAFRRYWPELTLTALTLYSVITSTTYLSMTRFTLTVFPLMVVGGSLVARLSPRTALIIVAGSMAWMGTVMGTFALGYWAG